jgi:hypothetical protein
MNYSIERAIKKTDRELGFKKPVRLSKKEQEEHTKNIFKYLDSLAVARMAKIKN